MNLSRSTSKTISRMLIGVLLLAQFAVASYACPKMHGMAGTTTVSSANTPVAMPPGCDQAEPASANLCSEHCRYGEQTSDTAPVPLVSPPILALLYSIPLEPQLTLGSGRLSAAADARWIAAPEPPHAILHCVFRI